MSKSPRSLKSSIDKEIEEQEDKILRKRKDVLDSLESPVNNENEIPMINFESDAKAPIIRYDLPSPSSYEGKNIIEINDIEKD